MSNSKLHKLKGKSQRNVIEKLPFEVKKFFDRKCGSIDSKLTKMAVNDFKEYKVKDILSLEYDLVLDEATNSAKMTMKAELLLQDDSKVVVNK